MSDIKSIPGTQGFMASTSGVIHYPDGNPSNVYRNADGYQTASVKTTSGRWVTFGVHRLVAFAHIPCYGDVSALTVNHIDHNLDNNASSNLEWATVGNNNLHAALMRGSERPMLIARKEDSFWLANSLAEMAEKLAVDPDTTWRYIHSGEKLHGWQITPLRSKDRVPPEIVKHGFHDRGTGVIPGKTIYVTEVGKEKDEPLVSIVFKSIGDAARHFKVSPSHIFQCISKDGQVKLFKRKYLITEDENVPILDDDELDRLTNPTGRSVFAYSLEDNQHHIFDSGSKFVRLCNLSRKAVTTTLASKKLRWVDGWLFSYDPDIVGDAVREYLKNTGVQAT